MKKGEIPNIDMFNNANPNSIFSKSQSQEIQSHPNL